MKCRWHYIFAAELVAEYTVKTSDIGLNGVSSIVFDYFAFENGTRQLNTFDDSHALQIPKQVSSLSILYII